MHLWTMTNADHHWHHWNSGEKAKLQNDTMWFHIFPCSWEFYLISAALTSFDFSSFCGFCGWLLLVCSQKWGAILRVDFSNSIPVIFVFFPFPPFRDWVISLPTCPCQVSVVKNLTLEPVRSERCRSEAGQPRQRNLGHKRWDTQWICAGMSWGDLHQGVSFPRAFLAHSQIIGGHLENLQNTDSWGKMLDNGSFFFFSFSTSCLICC